MTELHKFSLKKFCFTFVTTAFCIAITWRSEARHTPSAEIYSTLTTDTIPLRKTEGARRPASSDTTIVPDSSRTIPVTDTFALKFSKDTLDAPVTYEAADSGVLMIKEKKFYLYGRTKTNYKDVELTAPTLEFDQATNVLTAMNSKDSAGNVLARARFSQGSEGFQSDTIQFNFKTQRGLTKNTYSKQSDEMYVHFEVAKKVNDNTTFGKRLTMTTCEYDHPHFGFVAAKGKFITNQLAVTGPIHPEFEGVPVPVYLPFGFFPLKQGRHSGLLPPQFAVTEQFGIGLEGLGYYQVLNEYIDVTVRTNIYSYGGWSANIIPSYRKRYRYNGSMSLNIQSNKFYFKGDPDYSLSRNFNIAWNHTVDPKARPGTTFSASVNAGSTRYNQFVTNNALRPFQNQLTSSIAYSKTWQGKPLNLTLSANHNQNNSTGLINIMLPDAGFTVNTIYPFQRKEMLGSPRWYEKVGIGYSGVVRNQVSFYDRDTLKKSLRQVLDTLQWGAQHRFPISMSLPPLGPLIVSPFISYEETWLTHRFRRRWNDATKKIDTLPIQQGLFVDRQMSFGIGVNTALFGTMQFRRSGGALRHVIRPNINFNYRPNLSKKYYDMIQTDTAGRIDVLPQIVPGRNLFSSYGYGRFGGITFGIDNNLEMKVRNRKDSTGKEPLKKIRLIDGFGVTSGYNFLEDSLRLLPFNLYLRTTLFEKLSFTAQALYNPYQQDTLGRYVNKFVWQGDRFRLGRLSSGSISMSTSFQSKPRDPNKAPVQTPTTNINDPSLMADQERLQDYMRRNPAEFVDFNVPWTVNLSYSLVFSNTIQPGGRYKTTVNSNVSFNNSFSLTPKWNFSTTGFYDFSTKQLTMFTMSVSREMHCWQMSVNVTPIGQTRFFNIAISPKSSLLQDLKVNRTRYFYNY
ncbi:MAG TPA: putative LPS assembly protein LptD [Flavisolibacter sp.]|nr:putative LPS assembly protein LptD [Flavisolibacter sp.]